MANKNVFEVIIIGAGVIGASIAFHLTKQGCRKILVLEKNYIGSGSTEKCPGGIRQQFSDEANIRLATESVKFFNRFEQETGSPADFRQDGYLVLATTDEELAAFRRNISVQSGFGVDVRLVSPQDAKQIVPALNISDVLGATFCPTDGYADPYSVVNGFASAAKRSGALIYQDTEVIGVNTYRNKTTGVQTSQGGFEAPIVVNAAGPYAGLIANMVGLDLPMRPFKRHLSATGPLRDYPSIPDAVFPLHQPMVVDFRNGFWFRREGPSIIFGMRNPYEPSGFDTSIDWDFVSGPLAQAACHRLPCLSDIGITRSQAGLHSDTPDSSAILGAVPDVEGMYIACGFSGHGFMHSPAVGKHMAELVLEGKTSFKSFDRFSLKRFQNGYSQEETYFI